MDIQAKKFWQPLAIVAALLFVYANVLRKLVYDWWNDENYSHGLLIPFVIAYIIWISRLRLRKAATQPSLITGFAMALFALLLLWAGTAGAELFTQRMSLVFLLVAVTVYFFGWRMLSGILFPLALLVLAIPIPTIVLNKIAFPLQLFASRCAVWMMQFLDIPVLRQGNVIELMPQGALRPVRLEVVEACSGIRSLMTLVTLAALYAYFTFPSNPTNEDKGVNGKSLFGFFVDKVRGSIRKFSFWRSVLIVLAAVPIAIMTNALRVGGTGILAHFYGMKVAEGFLHTFSGWLIFVVAFILIVFFGLLIDRLFGLKKEKDAGQINQSQKTERVQA